MSTFQKVGEKMTNYRWAICAMLFFATTVNYLDRQVLSLTWDEFIKPEFHWERLPPYSPLYMQSACSLQDAL
jgi:ACS family hexuronate transporter-like MFS transporter